VKRETIITAIVFLAVGFMAGYVTSSQVNGDANKRIATGPTDHVHTEGEQGNPGGGAAQGLPQGHPPVDNSAMIKALEGQIAENPKDVNSLLQLANAYYDSGQWQKAADGYAKVLQLEPKNVNARTDLGTAYFNLGRPEEALSEYAKSLEADPNHQPTMFNTIIVLMHGGGDAKAAKSAWDRLYKINPSYPGLDRLKEQLDRMGTS